MFYEYSFSNKGYYFFKEQQPKLEYLLKLKQMDFLRIFYFFQGTEDRFSCFS